MNSPPPHPCCLSCASPAPTPTVSSLLLPGPSHTWNVSKDRLEGSTPEAIPEGDEHSAPAGLGMGPPWTPPSAPGYPQCPGGQGLRDVWVQAWELRGKIACPCSCNNAGGPGQNVHLLGCGTSGGLLLLKMGRRKDQPQKVRRQDSAGHVLTEAGGGGCNGRLR